MQTHIFHFVLTGKLKRKIKKLSKEMKLSISKTTIHVIEKSMPVLEKYQTAFVENESISKYQDVCWDSHVYLFFKEELFKKLKHICGTVFAFSMGIVIRKLLELYFEKTKKYKKISYDKVLLRYKRIYLNKKGWKVRTQQLCCRDFFYRLTYGKNFNLIGIDWGT